MTEAGERMRAQAAKEQLQSTFGEVQARLAPKALARDAKDSVVAKSTELKDSVVAKSTELAERGAATAKARPGLAAGAAALAGLLLLRGPVKRWRQRRRARKAERAALENETDTAGVSPNEGS